MLTPGNLSFPSTVSSRHSSTTLLDPSAHVLDQFSPSLPPPYLRDGITLSPPLPPSLPLSGSIPVGTIFGIFASGQEKECLIDDEDLEGGPMDPMSRAAKCLMSTLQPGTNLVVS